jgi:urease accessory protein
MNTVLLLLTDGRFPSGGHAHSSGLEAAVAAGRVTDLSTLEQFLRGRLATATLVAAAFTAATHATLTTAPIITTTPTLPEALVGLDDELDARTASPALRLASRRQGRALRRAGRTIWPTGAWPHLPHHPDGPHQPIALGLITAAAGLTVDEAALTAAYGALSGLASAAVRLMGLDPYQVQALLTKLAPACDATAAAAAQTAGKSPAELPAASAPLADISAEFHATWEVRLFAS